MKLETPEMLWDQPNKFARPASLELYDNAVIFHGYQEFLLMKDSITVLAEDLSLGRKQELLSQFFCPRYLAKRTVLDLGANSGFFCFWALQNGASHAVAVDMDDEYLRLLEEAREKLGYHNLVIAKSGITEWVKGGDVVLALALVHWIYSCTALFGSLDAVMERLAELANYMVIVEWIDPEDPAINSFNHLDWNEEKVQAPYTLAEFEGALGRHFSKYEVIGEVTPTRKLYVAFRRAYEIDLSGPFSLAGPPESILSGRKLTRREGVDYWSYLFDGGDVIYKQATLDLAEREATFLSRLSSAYFPRVLDVKAGEQYSVITLEKIHGLPLEKCYEEIAATPFTMHTFFQHALDLLFQLKEKAIMHRDIGAGNILVRDKKPVLLDFGWATLDEMPYISPAEMGGDGRPPDRSFCDVYATGKLFDKINRHKYPIFDPVIELMMEPDASLRFTDITTLKTLFASISEPQLNHAGARMMVTNEIESRVEPDAYDRVSSQLLKQIEKRKQKLSVMRNENERLTRQLIQREDALRLSQDQVRELVQHNSTINDLKNTLQETSEQMRIREIQHNQRIRVRDEQITALQKYIEELQVQIQEAQVLSMQLEEAQSQTNRAEERIAAVSAQLLKKQTELEKIRSTLGWRTLQHYGRIKYRYLLPIYRLFGQRH